MKGKEEENKSRSGEASSIIFVTDCSNIINFPHLRMQCLRYVESLFSLCILFKTKPILALCH